MNSVRRHTSNKVGLSFETQPCILLLFRVFRVFRVFRGQGFSLYVLNSSAVNGDSSRNSKKMHASSNPKQTPSRRLGLIQIHLAVFLFGFAGLFGKSIDAGPAVITFGRTFFAAIALLCGLAATGNNLSIRTRTDLATLCFSGLLLAVHWYTFFQSIQVSSVAVGLLSFSTFPVFTTFMEPYLFRKRLFDGRFLGERFIDRKLSSEGLETFDVVSSLMVVAGLALVVPSFDFSNNVAQGAFWGVLSGFTFAVLTLLNRMQVGKYPPLTVTFYQLGFATLFNLPFVILSGAIPSARDLLLLLALGTVCTALAHALFIASLRHIRAQLASITTGLEPVYGIVFAYLLMGEAPAARTVFGGLIILGAAFLPVVRLMRPSMRQK